MVDVTLIISSDESVSRQKAHDLIKSRGIENFDLVVMNNPSEDLTTQSLFNDHQYFYLAEPKPDQVKALTAYLKAPMDDTTVIISSTKPLVAFAKALKTAGGSVYNFDGRNAQETVLNLLKKCKMTEEAKSAVVNHVGENVSDVLPLIDTLKETYGDDEVYTLEQVTPWLGQAGTVKIWTLLDQIDNAQLQESLLTLDRILSGGNKPVSVSSMLKAHLEKIFRLFVTGASSESEAAKILEIKPGASTYPAKKALNLTRVYGTAVVPLLELATETDAGLKGGARRGIPERLNLEILIARMCTYPRKRVN